jgi:hypothetical protein
MQTDKIRGWNVGSDLIDWVTSLVGREEIGGRSRNAQFGEWPPISKRWGVYGIRSFRFHSNRGGDACNHSSFPARSRSTLGLHSEITNVNSGGQREPPSR